MENAEPVVVDNKEKGRLEIDTGGEPAILTYHVTGDRVRLIHTEVPPEFQKRGYASRLARAAMERAEREHLKVVPLCPFVRGYIARHPEYASLVATSG